MLTVNRLAAGAGTLLLATSLTAAAQDDNTPDQPRFRGETTAVRVPVVVINKEDQLVTTLTQDNFTILEDGVEQEIATFEGGKKAPLTLVILLEYSDILGYLRREAIRPAGMFAAQILGPEDYAALIAYDRKPYILSDFTRNKQKLLDGINKLVRSPSMFRESSLYDALEFALVGGVLEDVEYKGLAEVEGRTGLLLVATGINTFSSTGYEEALRIAANSGVPVYSIGIGEMAYVRAEPYLSGLQRMEFLQAKNALNQFSKTSGGRAYHVRFQGQLNNILESVAAMLRLQYTLTYTPQRPATSDSDASKRKIEVLVDVDGDGQADNDRLEVQHRREYYVKN